MNTSVIIATRNSAATIDECLASLVPDYDMGYIGEIIVIDGQSTDGTLEACGKYPVKLLTDEGRGVYAGLDTAWRQAVCELVMFIDSDAFIGRGFFPAVHVMFEDQRLGILGCLAAATGNNPIEKSIGQWWHYHGNKLESQRDRPDSGFFKRLYFHVTGFSEGQTYTSGPCYIARRECLETVNGFEKWLHLYSISQRLLYPGDNLLSREITALKREARWWTGAPAFHHPPSSLKKLLKQRYAWGKGDGTLLRISGKNSISKAVPPVIRLGAPLLGIWMALRYRNIRQMLFLPLAQYAWIAGYLASLKLNMASILKANHVD